jgi:hypothetical protein
MVACNLSLAVNDGGAMKLPSVFGGLFPPKERLGRQVRYGSHLSLLLVIAFAILTAGAHSQQVFTQRAAEPPAFAQTNHTFVTDDVDDPATSLARAAATVQFAEVTDVSTMFDISSDAAAEIQTTSKKSNGALPDAPSAHPPVADSNTEPAPSAQQNRFVSKRFKYIPSGFSAQPINGRDKMIIGLHDIISPMNFLAMLGSSGYEQLLNSQPNYGTDKGAFGQRLGAAAIRESSQGFFSDSIFSVLLHQDPRYYVLGRQHSFFHRLLYAGTRPLITRADDGHSTINTSLLVGYASAAALTNAYYPQSNRNVHDTLSVFGGSIGGAALGFSVAEFSDQVLQAFHLKRLQ